MNDLGPAWFWVSVVVSLLIGGGIGFALAARRLPAVKRSQELEAELDKVKAEMTEYRGQVNQHFSQTSELFHGLTERYRAIYQHLATGAHELCTNGQEALPLDLPESTHLPAAGTSGPEEGESVDDSASEAETLATTPEALETGARETRQHGA
jgi:uncharacterized membrane-anchored protein YhcB (DUF1043 family)